MARLRIYQTRSVVQAGVDRGVHGFGAIGGDGVQPGAGCGDRPAESANQDAASAGGDFVAWVRLGIHCVLEHYVFVRGAGVESTVLCAGSCGAGGADVLFLHQAVHFAVACGVGVLAGDRAGGGVDCDAGIA